MYECLYKRVTNTENTTVIMKGEKWFLHAKIFVPKTAMTGKVNKSQFEMYLHKTHFCILVFSLEWSHSHKSLQFIANEQKGRHDCLKERDILIFPGIFFMNY